MAEVLGTAAETPPVGRFAPSPSGRMHLGNLMTALMSWLSVKRRGGRWLLRIEDLDPQRSRREYALQIEDDLHWLGLEWDEGGISDSHGSNGPYLQSQRGEIYEEYIQRLRETGLTYPCFCRRADIMATQAPHQSDGRIVYAGTCRPSSAPPFADGGRAEPGRCATRLWVPDEPIEFTDRICGRQSVNLARHCGDFVVRRADGAWAYQFAVVVDDALMGVTEVLRGDDLLLSSAQQIYLYRLLGFEPPCFAHIPLVCNEAGVRLSKRDASYSIESLRRDHSASELLGMLAHRAGIIDRLRPVTLDELLRLP